MTVFRSLIEMAQHLIVDINKEPEIKESIERIGQCVVSSLTERKKNFEQFKICDKIVDFLPDDYKIDKIDSKDSFVLAIKPYNLKHTKREWGDYWKNACLECHFNKDGYIIAVFYPL